METVSVLGMLTTCPIFIATIISDMYVDTAYRGDTKAPMGVITEGARGNYSTRDRNVCANK